MNILEENLIVPIKGIGFLLKVLDTLRATLVRSGICDDFVYYIVSCFSFLFVPTTPVITTANLVVLKRVTVCCDCSPRATFF